MHICLPGWTNPLCALNYHLNVSPARVFGSQDYEAQLAAKEEAWAAAHAEVTERLNAATGGHPAGGGNRRQLSAVGALSGDSSAVQAQEDRRAGAHGGLRRRG